MSRQDVAFISQLSVNASDIARILKVSRQAVSRGLRSDGNYLNERKLRKLSDALPRIFGVEPGHVDHLIDRFYPHYKADAKQLQLAEETNIEIDGDMYIACKTLPYYMNVYKKLFFDLAHYINEVKDRKFYFAFEDPHSLDFSRSKITDWLDNRDSIDNSYVIICPSIEIFPFSVCGTAKGKPVVYFCEDEGFKKQNENNSRWIVRFIKRYLQEHQGLLAKLHPAP